MIYVINTQTPIGFLESAWGRQWTRFWSKKMPLRQKFQNKPNIGSMPYFSLCQAAERLNRWAIPGNASSTILDTKLLNNFIRINQHKLRVNSLKTFYEWITHKSINSCLILGMPACKGWSLDKFSPMIWKTMFTRRIIPWLTVGSDQ